MFYAALSFILGGHGDSGSHGIDISHDVDVGGMDIGDMDVGGADIGSGIDADGIGIDSIDVDGFDADGFDADGFGADGFDMDGIDTDGLEIGHDIDAGTDAGHETNIAHGAGTGNAANAAHAQHSDVSDTAGSPSPFSPVVMASAITTFGAVGLISMMGFGLSGLASTFVALGFSGAIGAAIFYGIVKFMYGSQSNSLFSLDDLIGCEADVITPVPAKGLGEIAYTVKGIRSTLAAKSLEGCEIRRGTPVIIREIAGSVAVVQRKLTIDDIELDDDVLRPGGDISEGT